MTPSLFDHLPIGTFLVSLWPFLIILPLLAFFKSRYFKGMAGEAVVNLACRFGLDKRLYRRLSDVTIDTGDGTTQIDHLIVSPFGIFVIETKNMKGWIFGGERGKEWTQALYKKKYTFQNPLRQNYRHVKALQYFLGAVEALFHPLVVFVGASSFKTKMPENVFSGLGFLRYVRRFRRRVLTEGKVERLVRRIEEGRQAKGFMTDLRHVETLKERHKPKPAQPETECPLCSSPMRLRTNRRTGERFWGCSTYPRCRGTKAENYGHQRL